MKRLIVTADDFGYSIPRDDGILRCYKDDVISQTSVMMNGLSVETAIKKALETGLPLGMHLNLSEGSPVGEAGYKTLVGDNGFFRGIHGLKDALKEGKVDLQEVQSEIQCQIDKFERLTGHKPHSVDGHQHYHVNPAVCEIFAKVMQANGINKTRLPLESRVSGFPWQPAWYEPFMVELVSFAADADVIFKKYGIWSPGFTGLKTMGSMMNLPLLQDIIKTAFDESSARGTDVVELMTHPGYKTGSEGGCGDGPDDFSQSADREYEMSIISDPALKKFYSELNIKLVSFKDC